MLIGRPIYYMEVIIGQFSSRGCIKAFDMVPIMKGIAVGQVYATALATTYYACVMGLTIMYLLSSFMSPLPWSYCREDFGSNCIDSVSARSNITSSANMSSAEIYFKKIVLRESYDLDNGIGGLNWDLVGCLALAWIIIGRCFQTANSFINLHFHRIDPHQGHQELRKSFILPRDIPLCGYGNPLSSSSHLARIFGRDNLFPPTAMEGAIES